MTNPNPTPLLTRNLNGGTQTLYRFDNNQGASLVSGGFAAYGGLEIAVIRFDPNDKSEDARWDIDYTTPITDDVLGYLTADQIPGILAAIAALPEVAA